MSESKSVWVILLIAMLESAPASAAQVALTGVVASVYDGDTFRLEDKTSVRVDGIDAPELHQLYGIDARDTLRNLLLGKSVTCKVTGQSYGRVVGRCKVDTQDVGAAMVMAGAAWNASEFGDRYRTEQRGAACGRIGLWRDIGPVLPRDWRRCVLLKSTLPVEVHE